MKIFPKDCSFNCQHYSEIDMGIYAPEIYCDLLNAVRTSETSQNVRDCPLDKKQVSDECSCDAIFERCRGYRVTMKGMKAVATKYFIPHAFNKWECIKCRKTHTKDW